MIREKFWGLNSKNSRSCSVVAFYQPIHVKSLKTNATFFFFSLFSDFPKSPESFNQLLDMVSQKNHVSTSRMSSPFFSLYPFFDKMGFRDSLSSPLFVQQWICCLNLFSSIAILPRLKDSIVLRQTNLRQRTNSKANLFSIFDALLSFNVTFTNLFEIWNAAMQMKWKINE